MKKKFILYLVVLCAFGYYSCQKNIVEESVQAESAAASVDEAKKKPAESNIFDPGGLVSASQHGKLDTIQKGFAFTEGPAVDKHGNIFFTDQPNDKICKW